MSTLLDGHACIWQHRYLPCLTAGHIGDLAGGVVTWRFALKLQNVSSFSSHQSHARHVPSDIL